MKETAISPKKQKLDTAVEAKKEFPPAYGSHAYWERRYQQNLRVVVGTEEEREAENDDVLPYHPWYFTYEELAPLILPIIVGDGHEEYELHDEHDEASTTSATAEKGLVASIGHSKDISDSVEKNDIGDSSAQREESEHSDDDEVDEEDDSHEMPEREGLAKEGPISIIEIGCGDMPLGKGLALALSTMEEATGAKADKIVKEVVCCDYSSTVIHLCKENQRRMADGVPSNDKLFLVDYVTADARKLQYPDCSFHLVLEKGTLDAMLSDQVTGVDSCIRIMTECARVLKEGGYIILVSHLNAQTANGVEWLNTVVVVGLRAGGGKYSKWEIEVHSSAVNDSNELNGDETNHVNDSQESERGDIGQEEAKHESNGEESDGDENSASPSSDPSPSGPGPAVYIIHNVSKSSSDDSTDNRDPPAVRLQFFSY